MSTNVIIDNDLGCKNNIPAACEETSKEAMSNYEDVDKVCKSITKNGKYALCELPWKGSPVCGNIDPGRFIKDDCKRMCHACKGKPIKLNTNIKILQF